jgi:hypothetical protein
MRRKAGAWMLFLVFLLLLSLGFTEYGQIANYLLISIRLVLIAILSIFIRAGEMEMPARSARHRELCDSGRG